MYAAMASAGLRQRDCGKSIHFNLRIDGALYAGPHSGTVIVQSSSAAMDRLTARPGITSSLQSQLL
jgi:hypothetical protein